MAIPAEYEKEVLAGRSPKQLREMFNVTDRKERKWRASVRRKHQLPDQTTGVSVLTVPQQMDAAKVWDRMVALQDALQEEHSDFDEVTVTINDDRPVAIAIPSDWHIGNTGTDHRQLKDHVDIMAHTKGLYCIVGGDGVDNFVIEKLAAAARSDMVRPLVQYRLLEYVLTLLKDKILVIGDGNHTAWTQKLSDIPMIGEIAARLKTVYTGQRGIVRVIFNDVEYVIYRQHKGRFNSSFNANHTVKQAWRNGQWDFDIGIGEHNHVPSMETFWAHGQKKISIRTGTYKVLDGHAKANGFWGANVGVPVVILDPKKKAVLLPDFLDDFGRIVGYLDYLRGAT